MNPKPTILIIDDDPAALQPIVEALQFEDYHVVQAGGPREALDLLSAGGSSIDLVVLDIMMPPDDLYDKLVSESGMRTGALLFADIRKAYPHLPVILLSAKLDKDAPEERWQASAQAVFAKPVLPSVLVRAIRHHTASKR